MKAHVFAELISVHTEEMCKNKQTKPTNKQNRKQKTPTDDPSLVLCSQWCRADTSLYGLFKNIRQSWLAIISIGNNFGLSDSRGA